MEGTHFVIGIVVHVFCNNLWSVQQFPHANCHNSTFTNKTYKQKRTEKNVFLISGKDHQYSYKFQWTEPRK